jgi:hypothetical protein
MPLSRAELVSIALLEPGPMMSQATLLMGRRLDRRPFCLSTCLAMTGRLAPPRQCDISVGTVIVRSISRVTPPSIISCRRECP